MVVGAFEKTNLKSKKVRNFFILLAGLTLAYLICFAIYKLGMINAMAAKMFELSLSLLVVSALLFIFLLVLKWQILRTGILAFVLLSLAHIFCAIYISLHLGTGMHAAGLVVFSLLFIAVFIQQSNLRIYLLDKTYLDVAIELAVAAAFIVLIVRMVITALTNK